MRFVLIRNVMIVNSFSHYEATIEEILNDGTCTVTFEAYGNTDVTEVLSLFLIYQF